MLPTDILYHECIRQVYTLFDKDLGKSAFAKGSSSGIGEPLRLSENSLNSLTKRFPVAMIFISLYVKALKKRSMHKFVFERESGPEAERRLITEMQKVASELDC